MHNRHGLLSNVRANVPFALFGLLMTVLWVAGGASRADAMGQVVVRLAAWTILIVAILAGIRPSFTRYRFIVGILSAMIGLLLLQLLPLPPALWEALPGRDLYRASAVAVGTESVWRPLSLVPDATINALSSLIVPLVALVLLADMDKTQRTWVPGLVLVMIAASSLIGLLQFSGARFSNPLINDSQWYVSGNLANRNHFALLLAMGCLIAPAWAFAGARSAGWRVPTSIGLVMLFGMVTLATGSRAGMLVVVLALVAALLIVRHTFRHLLAPLPRWVSLALLAGTIAAIALLILLGIATDRAVSIQRVSSLDVAEDLRLRALPTIWTMIGTYFPAGSGFGSFDPMFRVSEPFGLLKRTYFNHAHNDFIEIILDGGVAGAILLIAVLLWWVLATIGAWRAGPKAWRPRLGSAMLLLVFIASIFDYPARTPIIMTMIVVAAMWLTDRPKDHPLALPAGDRHL